MELRNNFYEIYIVLEKTLVQFVCTYLDRGRCNSVFSKILWIVISWLLLHGIAQIFIWNICIARDDIEIISFLICNIRKKG